MNGTVTAQATSDQRSPLGRKRANWTYAAPRTTSSANTTRPVRESGVVLDPRS